MSWPGCVLSESKSYKECFAHIRYSFISGLHMILFHLSSQGICKYKLFPIITSHTEDNDWATMVKRRVL